MFVEFYYRNKLMSKFAFYRELHYLIFSVIIWRPRKEAFISLQLVQSPSKCSQAI